MLEFQIKSWSLHVHYNRFLDVVFLQEVQAHHPLLSLEGELRAEVTR